MICFLTKITIFLYLIAVSLLKGEIMNKHILSLKEIIDYRGVFFIGEVGVNHDGLLQNALSYVDEAASSNISAIKFQSFTKDSLFAEEEYCKILNLEKDALSKMDDIVFKQNWYKIILARAIEKKIIFMSTPFSVESVDDMESINVAIYKVASCDINNIPLLNAISKTHKPVILSLGLASNEEIKNALSILKNNEVALLHCIVEYPTDIDKLKLNRIVALKEQFPNNIIGFSDHSIGLLAPKIAIALGAQIIEKHFTIEPTREDGDHKISISQYDFQELIKEAYIIQNTDNPLFYLSHDNDKVIEESIVKQALGTESDKKNEKIFTEKEKSEFVYAKRGIYFRHDMNEGDIIKESDIIALRPCSEISVSKWNNVIGKKLLLAKKSNSPLKQSDI